MLEPVKPVVNSMVVAILIVVSQTKPSKLTINVTLLSMRNANKIFQRKQRLEKGREFVQDVEKKGMITEIGDNDALFLCDGMMNTSVKSVLKSDAESYALTYLEKDVYKQLEN